MKAIRRFILAMMALNVVVAALSLWVGIVTDDNRQILSGIFFVAAAGFFGFISWITSQTPKPEHQPEE